MLEISDASELLRLPREFSFGFGARGFQGLGRFRVYPEAPQQFLFWDYLINMNHKKELLRRLWVGFRA